MSSQWRHDEHYGVLNHRRLDCLLNGLFRRRSKRHQSSASLAFVREIHWRPVGSLTKGPVTRKMLPFDDVIMIPHKIVATFCACFCCKHRLIIHATVWLWYNIAHRVRPQNGNIFRVTDHLCGEFTGHRWIPHTKASDAELWCFLWSVLE